MKTTIDFYQFRNWFAKFRPNNFTDAGLQALFNMLECYEDDTGEEIEFDPIAFCVEYAEYNSMEEFWEDYDKEEYPDERAIMDATFYYYFGDDSFIIQKF